MSTVKSEAPKRKREVSEAEREERDSRRQAKVDEEKAISAQHQELKESKLAQAEARFGLTPFEILLLLIDNLFYVEQSVK